MRRKRHLTTTRGLRTYRNLSPFSAIIDIWMARGRPLFAECILFLSLSLSPILSRFLSFFFLVYKHTCVRICLYVLLTLSSRLFSFHNKYTVIRTQFFYTRLVIRVLCVHTLVTNDGQVPHIVGEIIQNKQCIRSVLGKENICSTQTPGVNGHNY